MKFGINMFCTDYSIGPGEVAKAIEEAGFELLTFSEHTHIPTSRVSPAPGGGELPPQYYHTLDQFMALTAAAMATSRLLIGSGICLAIQHDPINLAKQVATIDHLSSGRFIFGIGGGWNREEMMNHGTNPSTRWRLLRERVLAMKEIWTKDEAEFHGDFVDFDPIWSWPKPVQKPHPPIFIGGDAPGTLERVVDYCDGWLPIVGRSEYNFRDRIAELSRLAAEAGRGRIPITVFATPARPEVIEEYIELGVDRYLLSLPSAPADEALARLDELAELVQPYK